MAKEAMISPQEERQYQTGWDESVTPRAPVYAVGWRVAQVELEGQTFAMAEPIFWTPCADEVEQDKWVYNPDTKTIVQIQEFATVAASDQPTAVGTVSI